MASNINENHPESGIDQPVERIRTNFVIAKLEIETLQTDKLSKNGDALTGVLQFFSTTVAALPTPSTTAGGITLVTDVPGFAFAILCYSDGVNWRAVHDVTIIVI